MADWGNAFSAGFGALADIGKAGVLSTMKSRHDQALQRVRHQYRMVEARESGIAAGQAAITKAQSDRELAALKHQRALEMQGLKGDQAISMQDLKSRQAMALQGVKDRSAMERAKLTQKEKDPKQIFNMQDGGRISLSDIIRLYQTKHKHSEFGGYPDENMESLSDFASSIGVVDFIDIGDIQNPFAEEPDQEDGKKEGIIRREISPERYESLKKYFMQ